MVEETTTERILADGLAGQAAREPAFVTAVRLRAERRIALTRRRAGGSGRDAATSIADERIRHATAEWESDACWSRVRRLFGLSDFETALLGVAIAGDMEPGLLQSYACIQDSPGARHATPWLVAQLFPELENARLSPQSPLVEWRLARAVEPAANPWAAHAGWAADSCMMLWLSGEAAADETIASAIELIPRRAGAAKICLFEDLLAEMLGFLEAVSRVGAHPAGEARELPPIEMEIAGGPGCGKRTLAGQCAAALGADLLAVDSDQLLADATPSQAPERLMRAVRMARLYDAILYWKNGEALSLRIWQAIGGYRGVMLFGGRGATQAANRSPAMRRAFELPALRREQRLALWKSLTAEPAPQVIENWILTPAEIARAAHVAAAGPDAVATVCQDDLSSAPGELFTPLPCPFTWDDIVLAPGLREHLAELESQVRLRWAVYEEWGFERLCPLGRGITAMFSGPSGTGKTMAAQVLARSLGLRLLRVDLAGVMNKYIGETEKRLKQVFDVCERANVMLFFDEADALFGQRTQVKDAHDRFANIEIDYLLQRMEQFDGIAILATNRRGDLDKAFIRRLRFILDFFPPGPIERKALWQRALHPRSPSGEELLEPIDWDFLANRLNMTGADIAMAALSAAFLARAQGSRIHMHHVLQASRRAMARHGVVVRQGEWEA